MPRRQKTPKGARPASAHSTGGNPLYGNIRSPTKASRSLSRSPAGLPYTKLKHRSSAGKVGGSDHRLSSTLSRAAHSSFSFTRKQLRQDTPSYKEGEPRSGSPVTVNEQYHRPDQLVAGFFKYYRMAMDAPHRRHTIVFFMNTLSVTEWRREVIPQINSTRNNHRLTKTSSKISIRAGAIGLFWKLSEKNWAETTPDSANRR